MSRMLERDDEFKLLGFLASLAGLLGIVVSVTQLQVGSGTARIVSSYFSILLVVFMFVSALTFLAALGGRDVRQFNMAVIGYFAGLLGLVVALAVATVLDNYYAFLPVGIVLGVAFYLSLQRLHRRIDWSSAKS